MKFPIPGYDKLDAKQVSDHLSQLSQAELATVETYERAHGSRPAVLEKLRYMRGSEPLPGYDDLTTEQIAAALAGATQQQSGRCATTSASSNAAYQCSMRPHACYRPRGER